MARDEGRYDDIIIPDVTTSQISDTTVVSPSTHDMTSVSQTGGIVVAYSNQGQGRGMPGDRLGSPNMTLDTQNASRRIAALAQGEGWQHITGAPAGVPGIENVHRHPHMPIMAPQPESSMLPSMSPFNFQSSGPQVSTNTSSAVPQPGGVSTGAG